jgi:hypothetical protein
MLYYVLEVKIYIYKEIAMLEIFKRLFSKPQEEEVKEDEPGRTFNKILTGKYYGLGDNNADKSLILELKDKKITQIKDLELEPKFARYLYAQNTEDYNPSEAIAIQVSFQKERYSRKRQMIHVSEMSFIVKAEDFVEFEEKLDINLSSDFRLLAHENTFSGKERRKEKRVV